MDGVIINCVDGSIVQETIGNVKLKKPNFSLIYLVWEQKDGLGGLIEDIGRLLKSKVKAATHNKCAIFIESHASKKEVKEPKSSSSSSSSSSSEEDKNKEGGFARSERSPTAETKNGKDHSALAEGSVAVKKAQDLLRYLDAEFPNIHARVIGVSDNTAACPALDECVNFVKTCNPSGIDNYSDNDNGKGKARGKRKRQQQQPKKSDREEIVYEFVS